MLLNIFQQKNVNCFFEDKKIFFGKKVNEVKNKKTFCFKFIEEKIKVAVVIIKKFFLASIDFL